VVVVINEHGGLQVDHSSSAAVVIRKYFELKKSDATAAQLPAHSSPATSYPQDFSPGIH